MSELTVEAWLAALPPERLSLVQRLRALVLEHDPHVTERFVTYGQNTMLCFVQGDEPKYTIGNQKNYVSFYSMVAYACPDLHAEYLAILGKIKMQKSCINIPPKAEFPFEAFAEVLKMGAAITYPTAYHLERRAQQKR